jgi:molybdate transport system substrate-binding protein
MARALLLLVLTLPLHAAEVRVMAAASLTDVLQAIARDYEKGSGDRIVFSFGGSPMLARQIAAGAPADLFLAADERSMDLVKTRVRADVLTNSLVVVVQKNGRAMRDPRELAAMRNIALAEPSTVPAGIYARTWLEKRGLWGGVRTRVIPTENVRAALAAVAAGNADAAIVYRTDALLSKKVRVAYEVPRAETPGIRYPFAILKDTRQPQAAARFLAHLQSAPARAVFVRYGFDVLR